MNRILKGLTILAKYVKDGSISAEHDEIWAGGEGQENMTEEDKKEMDDAGWTFDENFDSWHHFV